MNEILQSFCRLFWLSLVMAAALGTLLFIVTRRRNLWLRYNAAEAAFWIGAMNFFQQCLNTKETSLTEYNSAEAEFNALKKVMPP